MVADYRPDRKLILSAWVSKQFAKTQFKYLLNVQHMAYREVSILYLCLPPHYNDIHLRNSILAGILASSSPRIAETVALWPWIVWIKH